MEQIWVFYLSYLLANFKFLKIIRFFALHDKALCMECYGQAQKMEVARRTCFAQHLPAEKQTPILRVM